MQYAALKSIEYYLPETVLTNEDLAKQFPEFPADKILGKTGIRQRHVAAVDEQSSDMAFKVAKKLLDTQVIAPEQIDFLLFCTQTPDYLLPTSACMLQTRLGLPTSTGAIDFNLGCSGYVYGLSLAKALIESGQAKNVLLLTADNYTKLLEREDKSVRTIFGDAATASLVSAVETDLPCISPTVYGTDGRGAENLIVKGRGMRCHMDATVDPFLRMHGPKIFEFTLDVVPRLLKDILSRNNLCMENMDLFVFHQANAYMLEHLRKKLNIPRDKFLVTMDFCGNTVSSTIPIALKEAEKRNILSTLKHVVLVGFGVGYSWAGNIIDCTKIIGKGF